MPNVMALVGDLEELDEVWDTCYDRPEKYIAVALELIVKFISYKVFGHLAIKAGGVVNVTRCAPVEVISQSHTNCTEEIPVLHKGTEVLVDPISYVIKSARSPVHCM